MENIFNNATDFVDLDSRNGRRKGFATSKQSLYNKFCAQLPQELILNKTVLDLGSCLGAAGHFALTYGAQHYTGVEVQKHFFDISETLLSKYWAQDRFELFNEDIEHFLDVSISKGRKYDIVVMAGIIYGFLNVVEILEKVCKITNEYLVIDNMYMPYKKEDSSSGLIKIKTDQYMVKAEEFIVTPFSGISSLIDINAQDIILSTSGFYRQEEPLKVAPITDCIDSYNAATPYAEPLRIITRYKNNKKAALKLNDIVNLNKDNIIGNNNNNTPTSWVFDHSVANRFQTEAEQHIPSYKKVVDLCLDFANKHITKSSSIVDIGSALGYTLKVFKDNGYNNIIGIEASEAMRDNSLYKELVYLEHNLPSITNYDLILCNWTLHFIKDKVQYLSKLYENLNNSGYFILTDKTVQSSVVKSMYYDFKRSNGVSDEYIIEKEQRLKNVMHSVTAEWYTKQLRITGFSSVDIIYADLGFVTFLCKK